MSGDTKNVTDDGVTVTLVPKKAGFTGVLTRKYQINPLILTSKNIGEYIKAEVVNKTVAYTGNTIAPKNTDVKLTDKKQALIYQDILLLLLEFPRKLIIKQENLISL